MARHCMPQKQTHQIAMIALRSAAPVNGDLGPERGQCHQIRRRKSIH
jgi:hypothetical protein